MSVFAMTFAYNESFFLPRWVNYYASQLGAENLFVLDHGSTDLSTLGLGPVNIIRVPRTIYDEVKRVTFASHMHSALLQYYDSGFVMDADEFIVADPIRYKNLNEFASQTPATALACVGLELCHIPGKEATYQPHLPILFQREHVLFDSWICKRSFASQPIRFGGGFHTSDQPVIFDEDLFLIHLKNFDYQYRMVRQQITASWTYAGDWGEHAKKSVDYVKEIFAGFEARVAAGLTSAEFSFQKELETCLEKTVLNPSGEYDFNLSGGLQSDGFHILPARFRGLF
jgi:Glycosyl transferase family 2